jgi:hypothetical protein
MPATTHAISIQSGEPTVRLMSEETMKMPDPIIEPATSMVASVSVIALTNSRDDLGVVGVVFVLVVNARLGTRDWWLDARCYSGQKLPIQAGIG